ncbi:MULTISPECIES: STM4012 family radical SAM protein [Streptomyces]|uniref:STM4012 family radical SAM protein n=1 Tax=Streptomyces TaxID=1883 RepID=UPI000DA620B0|nr:STM4012 family radical SAM protein [Streptomyces sp. SID7805]MYU52732.1 coproporphyrinogen III oxidase family protein [Streptomyces sp. SID7805]
MTTAPHTTTPAAGAAAATVAPAAPRPAASPEPADSPRQPSADSPYQSYVYAYPHKTSYGPLTPRPALRDLWADQPQDALSLYLHIPFCEVRCGFCNLFTRIGAPGEMTSAYLDALERQAVAVRDALHGDARFAAAAFGGGTPTFLNAFELARLCDIAELRMGAELRTVPLSVETSPSTATADRLAVLAERGATRISIGVQSFVAAEARAAVRPQRPAEVAAALDRIRDAAVPVLNIDLIYGIDGQTERSWQHSLDTALGWRPEELYLYPLYVRPLTGLGRRDPGAPDPEWDAQRLRLYRHGRDHLLAAGYEQVSMRMFRRRGAAVPAAGGVDHACQTDGMIGLGCGARSYTSALHYSFDYAVHMNRIRSIIDDYISRPAADFARAEHGRYMTEDDARRRHLLQSVLQAEGMPTADYRARFGSSPADDFPVELARFAELGWLDAAAAPGRLRLSAEGLAHSDALGPMLFSPAVRSAMAVYDLK